MTPYDKANDVELTVPEDVKVVAHISCPDPIAAVGEELLHDRIAVLEHDIEQRDRRIERQSREIHDLQEQLFGYRERERQILDVIRHHQREDAYRRIHMQVNQVQQSVTDAVEQGRLTADQPMRGGQAPTLSELRGFHQCDCTMGRGSLIDAAARAWNDLGESRLGRAINSLK